MSGIKLVASRCHVRENQYVLENLESLWINLNDYSGTSFTVGVVYRHPFTTIANSFIENLSDCLTDLNNHKNIFYILGDININIAIIDRSSVAI